MSRQVPEHIRYKSRDYKVHDYPMAGWFRKKKNRKVKLMWTMTSNWRGYQARWEVDDGSLFLVSFHGLDLEGRELSLGDLFPGHSRVFADWFTGQIRLPRGRRLNTRPTFPVPRYGRYRVLVFNEGVLKEVRDEKLEIKQTPSVKKKEIMDFIDD